MNLNVIRKMKINIRNEKVKKAMIVFATVIMAFSIVFNELLPQKYKLKLGDISQYDITAPRDVENVIKTQENRKLAYQNEPLEVKEDTATTIEVISSVDNFLTIIKNEKSLSKPNIERVLKKLKSNGAMLTGEVDVRFLLLGIDGDKFNEFEYFLKGLIRDAMKEDITVENLDEVILRAQVKMQELDMRMELKNIGSLIVKNVIKTNRIINEEETQRKKESAYNDAKNVVIVEKGQRIISVGDVVTDDKIQLLEDLNMLEIHDKTDFCLMAGVFGLISLLALVVVVYVKYRKNILTKVSEMVMLSMIIIAQLLLACVIGTYQMFMIPVFFVGVVTAILLDLGLAVVVNVVLAVAVSVMHGGSLEYMYMAIISGTMMCFFGYKAQQRSKLTAAGVYASVLNVLVVTAVSMISKRSLDNILMECTWAFSSGIVSIILTIGVLPFLESVFNITTPIRLLELSNPNQPLLKRLLLEAPGTYHHSLMVGNLAEAAAEAIGCNALLARVGAYYHDIGKLKRPNFFMENQSGNNPHDNMTPNLSALIILSHVYDGAKLAKSYKLPVAIIDLIVQHHGTTKLIYFYHKAISQKKDNIKEENFRYQGPKPSSKEAVVVMLADSVEAAVRSLSVKTEAKIERCIRDIIKGKLNEGQFDLCNLTLKDMDAIAKSFMNVLSGCFHERDEYPKNIVKELSIYAESMGNMEEGEVYGENIN